MIAKITKGDSFGGLAGYLMKNGRGQVLDMRHLSADKPEDAVPEMSVAASLSRRTKQPVMHLSVSYDPADPEPSDADMQADAAEILTELGLSDNQAMIVRHRDAGHHHMHLMVNRVGQDGRAVSDSRSYAKAEAALRRIEARRGLSLTPGRHAPQPETGQRMTGPARSTDPRQHTAPDGVKGALLTARSWEELNGRLAAHGWRMERRQKAGRQPGAVLVGPDGQIVAAGKIDRGATYANVSRRIQSAQAEDAAQERAKAQAMRAQARAIMQAEHSVLKPLIAASSRLTRRPPGRGRRMGLGF